MLAYRLFSHDGQGNFSLLQEFDAPSDADAERMVSRWRARPLELWQACRKVGRWA